MLRRPPEGSVELAAGLAILSAAGWLASVPFSARWCYRLAADHGPGLFGLAGLLLLIALLVPVLRLMLSQAAAWGRRERIRCLVSLLPMAACVWLLRDAPAQLLRVAVYALLTVLFFRALAFRHRNLAAPVLAMAAVTAVAALDEGLQWLTPARYFHWNDLAVAASGALLTGLVIALGLRPPYLAHPLSRTSAAALCRAGAWLGALGLFGVSCTPARIAAWVPTVGMPREIMIEYGHRRTGPELGTFYTRLTPAQFAVVDQERGGKIGIILAAARRDTAGYHDFLREYSPVTDPAVYEARMRLFRRDRHLERAGAHAGLPDRRSEEVAIAWQEHRILMSLLPAVMSNPDLAFPAEWSEEADRVSAAAARRVSPVSDHLVTAVSERTLQWLFGLPTLVLALLSVWWSARAGEGG